MVERSLKAVSDSLEGELKLKGVMRVGPLAKGLLLRSDLTVQLVLLASEVPTASLQQCIGLKLQAHLASKTESENFTVTSVPSASRLEVKGSTICVHVGLTSPAVRGASGDEVAGAKVVNEGSLNKAKCLEHLAAIRHAKW